MSQKPQDDGLRRRVADLENRLARETRGRLAAEAALKRLGGARGAVEKPGADAVRQVEKTRGLLEAIINATPDFILVKDRRFRFILVNESAAAAIGRTPAEMVGRDEIELGLPPRFILGEPGFRGAREYDREALAGKTVHNPLDQVTLADGQLHYFDTYKIPLRDETGGVEAILVYARDVTERVTSARRLEESEEKFRMIAEQSLLGIAISQKSRHPYVNDAFARMLDARADDIVEWSSGEALRRIHPDDRERIADHNRKKLRGRTDIPDKVVYRRITGADRGIWVEQHARAITFEGEPALLVMLVDVTNRKRAEAEKAELEERLLRSRKMEALGLLAGGVAHDLNNVLSGMVAYPDLLIMRLGKDNPNREMIEEIQKSGRRAADIANDLLTLARRGVMRKEVLNLNAIVREYLRSPEAENLMARYPSVFVQDDLADDLLHVKASAIHLRKTVMNLVTNAAEAQPGGGRILVSTRNRYVDKPLKSYDHIREGDYVVLTVRDRGMGISDEDIARVFEPFYTKKVLGRSGTGLGMAVVWGTLQDHEGYVDLESREGEGTRFSLFFPATRETPEAQGKIDMDAYRGEGETILVVDDIPEQRKIAALMLTDLGYTVETADSGEAAVAYLKERPVDLMILDMLMEPGIDGHETYKRAIAVRPGQKAIIASGFSENDPVRKAQALGAGPYIRKPYSLEKIGMAVKEALAKGGTPLP